MTQATIATRYSVTEAQMSMAHRIVDMAARQVFFQVESQTTAGVEYIVRYDRTHKALTCTCPAGNPPIDTATGLLAWAPRNCWHKRAACAVAAEYKAEQERLMAEFSDEIKASAPYTVQTDETSSSLDGVKFETAPSGRLVPMR
jgi:hypothetical protein